MKQLSSLFLLIFMASCVKESSVDFRDKYVGNYKGTYTCSVPELPGYNTSRTIMATVVKGSDACQLLINNVGVRYYAIATLENNKYVYSTFEIASNNSGVTTAVKYSGDGSFENNSMKDSGLVSVYINGKEYQGTWGTNLTRE